METVFKDDACLLEQFSKGQYDISAVLGSKDQLDKEELQRESLVSTRNTSTQEQIPWMKKYKKVEKLS